MSSNKSKEPHVIINIGIPASGKSTWSKEFVRNNKSYIRVNRDDMRLMLQSAQMMENKDESILTDIINHSIVKFLSAKRNVIIDNTNLKERYLVDFINLCKDYTTNIEFRFFDVPLKTALERNANREGKVPNDVIERMHKDYLFLLDTFDFSNIKKYYIENFKYNVENIDKKEGCYIFDIDGTLALMNKKRGAFDWHKVHLDDVNIIVKEQANNLHSLGYKIIIVTGRDGVCEDLTKEWLDLHEISYDLIYTRPKNDFRKDSAIKTEIYNNHIKDKYFVKAVFDDRLQVLKTWNDLGLFCFNVNQGNKEF